MKKTIVFDFDGVLATYDGWKGFDVLGKPNDEAIQACNFLHNSGYRILIFTTRPATPILLKWLEDNGVKYDAINNNAHNPPMTSLKPIYHCYVDDLAINYHGQERMKLLEQISNLIEKDI